MGCRIVFKTVCQVIRAFHISEVEYVVQEMQTRCRAEATSQVSRPKQILQFHFSWPDEKRVDLVVIKNVKTL